MHAYQSFQIVWFPPPPELQLLVLLYANFNKQNVKVMARYILKIWFKKKNPNIECFMKIEDRKLVDKVLYNIWIND